MSTIKKPIRPHGRPARALPDRNFDTFLSRIESPTLRAVAQHWNGMRGEKPMPSWTDLPSPILSPYFKKLWGFRYDSKEKDFRGWFAGDKLLKWVGPGFDGGLLRDHCPRASYEQILQNLTKVITGPQIARTSGRLFITADVDVIGERIAFPMASDGETPDSVFGASDYAPPPLLGPAELVYENMEWYAI